MKSHCHLKKIFCLYRCSVTQGSRALCVKEHASAHCAAVPEELPVTFMFLNVCEWYLQDDVEDGDVICD